MFLESLKTLRTFSPLNGNAPPPRPRRGTVRCAAAGTSSPTRTSVRSVRAPAPFHRPPIFSNEDGTGCSYNNIIVLDAMVV